MTDNPFASDSNERRGTHPLASMLVVLRASEAVRFPRAHGTWMRGWLMKSLGRAEPELATAFDAEPEPRRADSDAGRISIGPGSGNTPDGEMRAVPAFTKEYSVSMAGGPECRSGLSFQVPAGGYCAVRITSMTARATAAFDRMLDSLEPEVQLGPHRLHCDAVVLDPCASPWAARTSYEVLRARWLDGSEPPFEVTLDFRSPTLFAQGAGEFLFPLPNLILEKLAGRWNAAAPAHCAHAESHARLTMPLRGDGSGALPGHCEMPVEPLLGCLDPLAYELSTIELSDTRKPHRGFVGWCTYRFRKGTPAWIRALVHTLFDFAYFSGVGYQTTIGMGQVSRSDGPPPAHSTSSHRALGRPRSPRRPLA